MTIIINAKPEGEIQLSPVKISEEGEAETIYELKDDKQSSWMRLLLEKSQLVIQYQDPRIDESEENLRNLLDELVVYLIEQSQLGTEPTESDEKTISPYDPDSIKVQTKPFNITLVHQMIESGDIDLAPDFQRNFVWNPLQKSRLIESILLRIPLPMFYFAEDDQGRITVVDGLQRLTTIKEFMDNKFPLRGLEYLENSCEGCYYSSKNKDGSPNEKKAIESKYFRWFNMTQFTVNVIDPLSPSKVKYDIFKRINTGGKPLNNQEIRNSLAGPSLRKLLKDMTALPEFCKATGNSIRSVRMEDQEVALRFICFFRLYQKDSTLVDYSGNMESTLDDVTEELSRMKYKELEEYIFLFSNAMQNAAHLFGKYAFRKILPKHLEPSAHKQLINKALFVSWSVLLSQYNPNEIRLNNGEGILAHPQANLIKEDARLFGYLSYGTNGKANLQEAFSATKKLIDKHLNI